MTQTAFITLRQVNKSYRRASETVHVLRDLDLDIDAGDFVAIMGPSGSGKTTLLNLLGGLDRADAGDVIVGDQRLETLGTGALARWRAGHVGFVFQSYNLLDGLTAARNVELPLLVTRIFGRERDRRVGAVLDAVGLGDRRHHKPSQLSGGQQQRLAIARALIADPDILLCDEPTGDLDRNTADEILGLLRDLNRLRGKTVLMVTHDPLAATFGKRSINIDKGKILVGSPSPSAFPMGAPPHARAIGV
jgi:putative ABC transport system ATP-binding protein